MPITITSLLAYDGPNLYGPQPCVVLHVHADNDHSAPIRAALKDAALSVGVIIGSLAVAAAKVDDGFRIAAMWITPTPALGAELARYVVAGLNAQEMGDEDWDAEEPLWALGQRRRREALPLPALQLIAEARRRNVPAFVRVDGQLQLGYGARSTALDLAPLHERHAAVPLVVWDDLGAIPIIAVTGGPESDAAAHNIAATLRAQSHPVGLALQADFDLARALLAQPYTAAVISLDPASIAARGLAFDRCAASVITGMPNALPPHIGDRDELARVLGVPMLITDPAGYVALDARTPEIVALAQYAPCRVVGVGY